MSIMAKEGKKPIGKIILIVVIVLVVVGVIGSMGGNGSSSDNANQPATSQEQTATSEQTTPEPDPEPYTVVDETLISDNPYMAVIAGTLTNNTDSDKSYIQVEYVIYDADGAQIGTALANTNNLKAGGTWKFEAASTVEPDEVASWELADVTGF